MVHLLAWLMSIRIVCHQLVAQAETEAPNMLLVCDDFGNAIQGESLPLAKGQAGSAGDAGSHRASWEHNLRAARHACNRLGLSFHLALVHQLPMH